MIADIGAGAVQVQNPGVQGDILFLSPSEGQFCELSEFESTYKAPTGNAPIINAKDWPNND
jgi:hypothetical protein